MKEQKVQVYYISVKNKQTKRLLTRDELRGMFQDISELDYSRGQPDSMLRELGKIWYGFDVFWSQEQELAEQDRLRFVGSRIRTDELPMLRFDKDRWDELRKPANADLVEVSHGVFYFPEELTEGCILFLLKNHHGMSMTRIKQYIKNVFENYTADQTTVTTGVQVQNTITQLNELRYVFLDNKTISPGIGEGMGDFHDRSTHPNEPDSLYDAARIKLDVREMPGTPMEKLKRIFRDFTGSENISEELLRRFVDESNTKLTAVKQGQTRQEDLDLTKNLYAFKYATEGEKIDENHFYTFCDAQYENPDTRRELIRLARGIANINDGNH